MSPFLKFVIKMILRIVPVILIAVFVEYKFKISELFSKGGIEKTFQNARIGLQNPSSR